MKITNVQSPNQIAQANPNPQAQAEAKARAIAVLQGRPAQAQQEAVENPSQVSAEELSAIQTPSQDAGISDNPTEVSTEETVEAQSEPKPDLESERRFQKIAQQERALRAKIQQQNIKFKQREQELAKREQELAAKAQQDFSNYIAKDRIKEDPLTVLEEAGASFDDLTNQALNRQPTDPRVLNHINKLQAKIDALEQETKASKQSYVDQQQQSYQAAVKQIRTDATNLVNSDPEFETVKAMGAVNDIVELIEKTFEKDGYVLSVEEAAKEVENYLIDEGMKITQIDKIRKRMEAANASKQTSEKKPQTTQQSQKTLTNATSSTRPLTVKERAIAAFEGRLKT